MTSKIRIEENNCREKSRFERCIIRVKKFENCSTHSETAGSSLFTSVYTFLTEGSGVEQVGRDTNGNVYFKRIEQAPASENMVEKRWIRYHQSEYDPASGKEGKSCSLLINN